MMAESFETKLDNLIYRVTSLEAVNYNLELERRVAALETLEQAFLNFVANTNLRIDALSTQVGVLETTTITEGRFNEFVNKTLSELHNLQSQISLIDGQNFGNQIGVLEQKIEQKIEVLEKEASNCLNVKQSKEKLLKQKEEVIQHVEKIEKRAQTNTNVLLISVAFFLGFNSILCYNNVVSAIFQGGIRIFGIIWFVIITYFKVDEESRQYRLMTKKHAELVQKAKKVDEDAKKEMILVEASRVEEESGKESAPNSNVGDSIIGIGDDPSVPLITSATIGDPVGGQSDGVSFSLEMMEGLQPYKFRCRHMFPTVLTGVFGIMITLIMLSGKCKPTS